MPLEKSFALVIVVDENCASSDWCLQALRYFDEAFGNAGLDARLYIRARLQAHDDGLQASDSPAAPEALVAQWFNWPNWANWSDWNNWNNWNNWLKWGKY